MVISLYSPDNRLNSIFLSNYAYVSLVDPIKRLEGVGDVQVFGAGRYAMRIWLDTNKMAAQNISIGEIKQAIQAQNTVNPGGQIGAEPAPAGQETTYTILTKGRLSTAEEFGNIIVRSEGQSIIYLRDVAQVELGSQTYGVDSKYNGQPTGAIAIFASPGSNAINTVDNIEKLMHDYSRSFPSGMTYSVTLDTTQAVRASIEEIVKTLLEALALVVIVVFVFLQGWRATLIPAIAVPVSIIATFAIFPLLGFTLNTICLMGMVLAIGLVVDDAIVVVEAVEAHMEKGLTPRQAAFAAMEEVSGPVIAIALVLAAVFLPSLLLPGITGTLFQQFAVTIAISMLISAFNALTLSPALSALMLKHKNLEGKNPIKVFYRIFNKSYDKTASVYTSICHFLTRKLVLSIPLLALITYCIYPVAKDIPNGFLPDEDQGYLFAGVMLPANTSLQVTSEAAQKISAILKSDPNVDNVVAISGFNLFTGVQSTNNGFFFVCLKNWSERPNPDQSAQALCQKFNYILATQFSESAFVALPPAIAGVGTSNDITLMVEDRAGNGPKYLNEQLKSFEALARGDKENGVPPSPEIGVIRNMMSLEIPLPQVTLDEQKCATLGVDIKEANTLLQAYMGSLFINYITLYGQQWQVYIQAQGENRTSLDTLKNYFVNNKQGESVPMSTLVTITETFGPDFVLRQNLYNAGKLSVTPGEGYSSEQAMEAIDRIFKNYMPTDMGYSYADMSYQEQKAAEGTNIMQIFMLSSLFVFLILAALYERWTLPISIFLTIPIAALGAFLALHYFKYDLNLYAQIGLIMLIGLAAKNAILIVEFAVIEMERGKALMEATLSAARIRLRPILMTSFAFILGCVPLAIASGSGANARNIIGIVVIAGMLMATVIGVFLIPCSFYFIMKLFRVKIHAKGQETEDPDEVIAMNYLRSGEHLSDSETPKH